MLRIFSASMIVILSWSLSSFGKAAGSLSRNHISTALMMPGTPAR